MRITKPFPLALLLIVGCQWNGAGELSAARDSQPNTQPNAQPNANALALSSAAPIIASTTSASFSNADFARHVELRKSEIRKKVRSGNPQTSEFSFVIQRPFVVIGDEAKEVVQQRAEDTVKWAVDRLKQDFFPTDPREILSVWLFKDAASYEKHAALLFGDKPTTPYGYYSSLTKH